MTIASREINLLKHDNNLVIQSALDNNITVEYTLSA